MRMPFILLSSFACFACFACSEPPTGEVDDDPGPDADAGGFVELIGAAWTLPAQTEAYLCARLTIDEDVWLTAIRPRAPLGTHHTVLSAGPPSGPDGVGPCQGTSMQAGMIYGSGVGTDTLVVPDGAAIRIEAGQQVLLNLHLFNVGAAELSGDSGIEVTLAPGPTASEMSVTLAGKATGPGAIGIGRTTYETTCTAPRSATVHLVMPHMHLHGTAIEVTARGAAGEVTLLDSTYYFDDQRYHQLAEPVDVVAGDQITMRCTYVNDTGQPIEFGESTENEMCVAALATIEPLGLRGICGS